MSKRQSKQPNKNNTTRKHIHIHGHIEPPKYGWKCITIKGTPQQRGFAHGYLLHKELQDVVRKFPFLVKQEMETTYKHYMTTCKCVIEPILKTEYPEFYQELESIVRGAHYQNAKSTVTLDILIAWNAFMSMYEYLHNKSTPKYHERCSAFIATGDATKNKQIVMGHTTHTDLVSGALFNIVLYMIPEKGIPFMMQTAPGCIASGTDWFLTNANIIGCETTIGDINYRPIFDKKHHPYFCRIRQAMQYGKSLRDYSRIMTEHNAGDYACSWLFGDTNTNEIMLCELGLDIVNIQTKKNGIYYGMNSAISSKLRTEETDDQEFFDMTTSSGSRNARFEQLFEQYYGKLTPEIATQILGDHIDPYTQENKPTAKTICVHSYDDPNTYNKYYPHGCVDVKAIDSNMAKERVFLARFGPACGKPFYKNLYIKKHPSSVRKQVSARNRSSAYRPEIDPHPIKYKKFEPYLENFPHQPITKIEFINHL
jgi:Phospholipase B